MKNAAEGPTPILVKTQRALRRDMVTDKAATFISDDESGTFTYVSIDGSTWRDLGSPDEITVTIEPGNTLNSATVAADLVIATLKEN